MPTVTLHPKSVGALALPSAGRIRYWDDVAPGLHVLVTSAGSRVYKARYQRADGTRIDYRIGRVEDWALSAARDRAEKIIKEAREAEPGKDPQFKKLKARSKEETFAVLARNCMASLSLRPSTEKNWGGLVKNYLVPRFGNTNPADIDRRAIRDFTEKLGKDKPVQAARAFEVLRRIFSWGVENEHLKGTPFVNLKKPPKVQQADSLERDRYLSRAEIHAIFKALDDDRFRRGGVDHYIRLLFETAVRRDEMLKATWKEVDLDAKFFTIQTLRYKSKKAHQVPLTPAAEAALKSLRGQLREKAALAALGIERRDANGVEADKLEAREAGLAKRIKAVEASPFVFPGPDAKKPRSSPQRAFEALRRRAGFEDWTLHDIRRTVSNELARSKVLPHVKEAILGHAPDKLTRTYSKHVPLLEMRAALEAWSKELDSIIRTAPSVHEFQAREA